MDKNNIHKSTMKLLQSIHNNIRSVLNRLFPSNNLKMAISLIDEADDELGLNMSFYIVREYIVKVIYQNPKDVSSAINSFSSPKVWAYIAIANTTGNLLESGKFHMYRGVLDKVGKDLLFIYNNALYKLAELGEIDDHKVKEQKSTIKENIKNVG